MIERGRVKPYEREREEDLISISQLVRSLVIHNERKTSINES